MADSANEPLCARVEITCLCSIVEIIRKLYTFANKQAGGCKHLVT